MATITENVFTSYELSDEEQLRGQIFDIGQTQVLQNELSRAAEEKLTIPFDPKEPELFMQAEAFKRGQIELLQYLLDSSLAATQALPHLLSPDQTGT